MEPTFKELCRALWYTRRARKFYHKAHRYMLRGEIKIAEAYNDLAIQYENRALELQRVPKLEEERVYDYQ